MLIVLHIVIYNLSLVRLYGSVLSNLAYYLFVITSERLLRFCIIWNCFRFAFFSNWRSKLVASSRLCPSMKILQTYIPASLCISYQLGKRFSYNGSCKFLIVWSRHMPNIILAVRTIHKYCLWSIIDVLLIPSLCPFDCLV